MKLSARIVFCLLLAACRSAQPDAMQKLGEATLTLSASQPLYWYLGTSTATKAADASTIVATVDSRNWVSSFGTDKPAAFNVTPVATIGPMALPPAVSYKVDVYLAVMPPGTSTAQRTYPGPAAWYVLEGEQNVETSGGTIHAPAGGSTVIEPGTPFRLTNPGTAARKALFVVARGAAQ